MTWPEGEHLKLSSKEVEDEQKVSYAEESLVYNQLAENEM